MAVQRKQVLTHYCDHYAKKSEFFDQFPSNAIRFKICTKNSQINTTEIAEIL